MWWRSSIGLDIDIKYIKALQLERKKGKNFVRYGITPTPPGAIIEGKACNIALLSEAIKNLIKDNKFKGKKVIASLPDNAVTLRYIYLPVMTEKELAEAVKWESMDYFPESKGNISLDYKVLGFIERGYVSNIEREMRVLLAAVEEDLVMGYIEALQNSGLYPVAIEPSPVSIWRGTGRYLKKPTAVIDMEGGIVNITLIKEGFLHSSRLIPGIFSGMDDIGYITREIGRFLDFYRSQNGGRGIEDIVLAGEASCLPAFSHAVTELTGLEVIDPDILRDFNTAEGNPGDFKTDRSFLFTTFGLSLRRRGSS